MKVRFFTLLMILLLTISLSLPVLTLAQSDDTSSPFTLYSSDPVVLHSDSFSDWDGRYTDPGAVFYHDGLFHMFRNGFRAWPASVQIGYLTSPDGLTWTEVSAEPVLLSADVAFTDLAALASSALVTDDGTWMLYFYTWSSSRPPKSEIGLATADNPLGPWSVHPEPVLTLGSAGAWDDTQITAPSVVRTDDGYAMYYSASDANQVDYIGMAASPDGITWTKHDDPATSEAPFAESDPLFGSTEDGVRYHQPRVERTHDGLVMVFRTAVPGRPQMTLRVATSSDGMTWNIVSDEPVWERTSIPNSSGFWFTATAYHEGTLYLYVEGGRNSYTDVYVATSSQSFFE